DVIARRQESFKETISETIQQGGLEPYLVIAEQLGEEFSPTDLAAAAFKMLLGESPDEAEDKLAAMEPDERKERDRRDGTRDDRREGRGERRGGGGNYGPERGMTRLYIDVGREEGVRPADLVGAIANEAGIPGNSIGAIELYDHFSFVEVPANRADRVLKALKGTTIRKRKVTASIAKPRR
ncbi:MAG TPA: DbpA RNA binding domain-containing protein, partial [Aggregatilineales bacterium]|nr:DbpA RNA binding domain-containing protein [Aggregatilineales bacterium]